MEGGDGAHALDLVNMTSGLGERLANKGLGWAVAEQQQAPGLGKLNVPPRNLGAGFAVGRAHAGAGDMKTGEGGTVSLVRGNLDRGQHALGEFPGFADGFAFEVLDTLAHADRPDADPATDLRVLELMWLEKLTPYGARGYNPAPRPT